MIYRTTPVMRRKAPTSAPIVAPAMPPALRAAEFVDGAFVGGLRLSVVVVVVVVVV